MKELTDGNKLRIIRTTLGFTQKQLGIMLHMSHTTIGKRIGALRQRIHSFIEEHSYDVDFDFATYDYSDDEADIPEKSRKVPKRCKEQKQIQFVKGCSYLIYDKGNSTKSVNAADDFVMPATGKGCVFVYKRKEGKHHMFQEARGGWTRTYTDVQLMGKHIKEV